MVFVLDRKKRPLMPCSEKRARLLLTRQRAVVHRLRPFTIRMKDRLAEDSSLQPVVLKLDPGSKRTGIALALEKQGDTGLVHQALHLAELEHKSNIVVDRMRQRAARRRRRRTANLRYRPPRFNNRRRPKGWLTPSMRSRVGNIVNWARRYASLSPLSRIALELVKFDTQAMTNPEISGVEYQRGELLGFEIWEYLLEKWGRKCAYCGKEGIPLEKDHIIPKSRGGSNRVSNLTVCCRHCNESKGDRTAAEFGHPEVQAKARIPLKDAAGVNTTRWATLAGLKGALGLQVDFYSGGRTKWNRTRFGLAKTHALDALCVGDLAGVAGAGAVVLQIRATGRGLHRRCLYDKHGFPRAHFTRQKVFHGFMTGDLVRAVVPSGKSAGVHVGRVNVSASGSFLVGGLKGARVRWRYCQLLQRADGYDYSRRSADL